MKIKFLIISLIWTLVIGGSYFWNRNSLFEGLKLQIEEKLRGLLDKDIAYRNWTASHNGVYVPITEATQPNEFLKDIIKHRDILHPDGRMYTLINPARVVREVNESFVKDHGIQTQMISDRPVNENNAPDDWETKALQNIRLQTKDFAEFGELQTVDGERVYRIVRGLKALKSCLLCHEKQGYKEGDLRGGLSITYPVEKHYSRVEERNHIHLIFSSVILILGYLLLYLFYKSIITEMRGREVAIRNERVLETILGSIREIVFIDDGGEISEANNALYRLFGCKDRFEFRQKKISFDAHIVASSSQEYLEAKGGLGRWIDIALQDEQKQYKIRLKIGEDIATYSIVVKKLDILGSGRVLVLLHDISEHERTRKELELLIRLESEKRRESESVLMQQAHFASISELLKNISHHWRQPLHVAVLAIQNAEDMVTDSVMSKEKVDLLQLMKTAQDKIHYLSQTIDRFTKIFKEQRVRTEFSMTTLLADVSEFLRPQLRDQNIELYLNLSEVVCWGSISEIEQVILSVFYNSSEAIRATKDQSARGWINVSLMTKLRHAVIVIEDNGGGIKADNLDKIFEPYYTTRFDGNHAGIGLYMSRIIIEKQHYGTIEVKNSAEGSIVTISIPVDMK